jgi:hypothetical protein
VSLPKTWTECHEEITRKGMAEPCDARPVVALRTDITSGWGDGPMGWYPVCAKHVRPPMVELWDAIDWASGPDLR